MLLTVVLCGFAGWLATMAGGRLMMKEQDQVAAVAVVVGFIFIMLGILAGR